jgi:predicted nucleotidyltransferase
MNEFKQTGIGLILEDREVARHLKKVLRSLGIEIHHIILFGSRARGESTTRSDYDFLIVVKEGVDFQEKRSLIRLIRRRMAEQLIPVDIFIKSKEEFEKGKEIVGTIVHAAAKDGVEL